MDYRYGSDTIFKIEYHFVFVTKYRYEVLIGDVGYKVKDLNSMIGFSRPYIKADYPLCVFPLNPIMPGRKLQTVSYPIDFMACCT